MYEPTLCEAMVTWSNMRFRDRASQCKSFSKNKTKTGKKDKTGVVAHTCNSRTREEARTSKSQGQSWLYSEFKASLGHMRTCLKKNNVERRRRRMKR